jgi:hypothetical protein
MKISELSSNNQVNEVAPALAALAGLGARAMPYVARGGRALKNLFTKKADNVDDLAAAAQRRVDPTMGSPKPRVTIDQARAARDARAASQPAPAAPSATTTAAPAADAAAKSTVLSKGKDAAKWVAKNPIKSYLGFQAADAALDDDPFVDAFTTNIGTDVVDAAVAAKKIKDYASSKWPGKDKTADNNAPAPANEKPADEKPADEKPYDELEPEEFPDLDKEKTNETILSILKLSGQKPITERDNVVGIIKPKKIEALNESVDLSECGGMMSSSTPSQPATLNISATASNGDEVANMLKSIMQLAGVKPVTTDMMPHGELLPSVAPTQILGRVDGMEETYDNTPEEKVEPYDPNSMAHVINKISSKEMASTPYQSASNPLSEEPKTQQKKVDEDVYHGLLRAYQEFKNSQ